MCSNLAVRGGEVRSVRVREQFTLRELLLLLCPTLSPRHDHPHPADDFALGGRVQKVTALDRSSRDAHDFALGAPKKGHGTRPVLLLW